MINNKILHFTLGLAVAGTAAAAPVLAADYPTKPIRFIVAFPPGGPADITARLISPKLSEILGQPVVIENRGGAAGNVGAQAVAKADPDGYSFLVTTTSFAVNPALWGKDAGYNAETDFVPVSIVSTQPNVIVVHQGVPVKNLGELKTLASTKHLSYATPGNGTTPALTADNLFQVIWKTDMTSIPYRGAGPASAAVVGGEPLVGATAVAGILQFAKAGKVRPLAVSSQERVAALPDVPTLYELGYKDILDYTWTAVLAPKGTPPELVKTVNEAINKVIATPELKTSFDVQALAAVGGTPEAFKEYLGTELQRWAKIVKDTGAKPD